MSKLQRNSAGFGPIEGLLLIVIIALVIGLAWYVVLQNRDKTTPRATTATDPESATNYQAKTKFVNIIYDGSKLRQVTPEEIARTEDQIGMLKALHISCGGSSVDYITVHNDIFDVEGRFRQEGNYAFLHAGVCTSTGKTLFDAGGLATKNYLHKGSSGGWVFDASETVPSCAEVDGLGYPRSLVGVCYDNSTVRLPR